VNGKTSNPFFSEWQPVKLLRSCGFGVGTLSLRQAVSSTRAQPNVPDRLDIHSMTVVFDDNTGVLAFAVHVFQRYVASCRVSIVCVLDQFEYRDTGIPDQFITKEEHQSRSWFERVPCHLLWWHHSLQGESVSR
jgi:hypothetical protein